MMKSGTTYEFGDLLLIEIPFTDTNQSKLRPAMVLFEEYGNVIVAQQEGLVSDSVLKLNYIFTISTGKVRKMLHKLSETKKQEVCGGLKEKFSSCFD